MNIKTPTLFVRSVFLVAVIATIGTFTGCATCYRCKTDCPYGSDNSPAFYDRVMFGWLPDSWTLTPSGQCCDVAAPAEFEATANLLESEDTVINVR